jgi:Amt family ammonium transporter
MGAIGIGIAAGFVCLWAVTWLKGRLGYDDALDVFGVHGVGGALGALLTGVFAAPALGGTGVWDYVANAVNPDYSILTQVIAQAKGVVITVVWSSVVSLVAYKLVDLTIGLRATDDRQREGLDTAEHGERAYT